ncbi:hypothetical protein GCM10010409_04300 [Mycolicibacterium diernhoferi]
MSGSVGRGCQHPAMGVVIGSEALAAGRVTRHGLRTRYTRLFPDVYGPANPSVWDKARAAWLWSGRRGVVAGVAASALHHAKWVDDDVPIELLWRNTHPPAGLIVRNEGYTAEDGDADAVGRVATALFRRGWRAA